MPHKSFGELTSEEVLMLAISIEESNGTRLRTFAELFADYTPDAGKLFAEMADEEDQHTHQLEVAYERQFGERRRTITENDVKGVIEAHDLDDAEYLVFDDMTLRRVLETILKTEHEAEAFYRQAQEKVADPELAELYRQLAEFEDGHVQWIETRLDSLGEST